MSDTIRTIKVNTKPEYTVSIGAGLLKECGERMAETMQPCRMAVITDSNVAPLYLEQVLIKRYWRSRQEHLPTPSSKRARSKMSCMSTSR